MFCWSWAGIIEYTNAHNSARTQEKGKNPKMNDETLAHNSARTRYKLGIIYVHTLILHTLAMSVTLGK